MNQSHVVVGIIAIVLTVCGAVFVYESRKPPVTPPTVANDSHAQLRQSAEAALASMDEVKRTFDAAQTEIIAEDGFDVASAMEELRVAINHLREVATEVLNGRPYEGLDRKFAAANEEFLGLAKKVSGLIKEHQLRKSAERIRQANRLGFAGIDFDDGPREFLLKFPGETPNWPSNEQQHSNVIVYCLLDHKPAKFASFEFIDGKLHELTFSYDWLTTGELGGRDAIIARLVDRIGPPHRTRDPSNPGANCLAGWDFPERKIDVDLWSDGDLCISIEHSGLHALRQQRRTAYESAERRHSERKDAGF